MWGEAYGEPSDLSVVSLRHEAISLSSHASGYSSTVLIPAWTDSSFASALALPDVHKNPFFYVAIYGAIGLATAALSVFTAIMNLTGALRASRKLFQQLLFSVVHATMRWYV